MQNKKNIRKQAESIIESRDTKVSQNLEKLSLHETQKIVHELEVHQIELELQNEELLKTQEELETTKKSYFDLYDMAPIGYCTLNEDGLIEEVNLAMSSLLGKDRKKLIKQPLSHFIYPQDQDTYYLFHKKVITSLKQEECELKIIQKNKTLCWVSLSATKGPHTIRLLIKDISERKDMEKKLKEKDEMILAQSKQAAMGEMISMIAHQWKQPLGVISMDVNNLELSIGLEEEITTELLLDHVAKVNAQVEYLSKTIQNFRNYFKPQDAKELVSIDDVIKDTLNIIGTSLVNNNIRLNINNNIQSSLYIYKASLIQVLLNIIGNAKDVLLIKKVSEEVIDINVEETQDTISISICDNGGGVPKSIINKLAQPYFTTKEALNGTGLGLYISRTILKKHLSGILNWHNTDKGACFKVMLKKS